MNRQNTSLLEPVSHMTKSLPISVHHTVVPPEADLVLYLHWHSEVEFLYIEHGETDFFIEEQEYHLKAGDAILVPPNLLHKAEGVNGSDCEFYAIVFSTSFLTDYNMKHSYVKYIQPILHYGLRCSLHLVPSVPWQKNILKYLKMIFEMPLANLDQCELQMHGMLLIIWQMLYNNHLSIIEVPNNISKLAIQLEQSIHYIHSTYYDEITLQQLAEIAHLSEGQFCRQFKQLTGFTPISYLNRYRIMKSCEYLRNTSKKVTEIATLCGFNNISFYNREFIKYIKLTPSAYRKV